MQAAMQSVRSFPARSVFPVPSLHSVLISPVRCRSRFAVGLVCWWGPHYAGANKLIVSWANRKDGELDVPKEVRGLTVRAALDAAFGEPALCCLSCNNTVVLTLSLYAFLYEAPLRDNNVFLFKICTTVPLNECYVSFPRIIAQDAEVSLLKGSVLLWCDSDSRPCKT